MSMLLRRGILASGAQEDMNFLAQYSDIFASGDLAEATTITAVDLDRTAILLLSAKLDAPAGSGDAYAKIRAEFTSTTEVTFSRGVSGRGILYNFAVVEFPNAISVKHYSLSIPSTSATKTITSVDSASNRIIIFSTESGDGIFSDSYNCRVTLTNNTTVTVDRGGQDGTAICDFFVIELPPL